MKYVVVSVFDRAAGAYSRPAYVGAVGLAVRSFQDEVNRDAPDNEVSKHPDDFDLYHLGSFDDVAGRFELFDQPKKLAWAGELKLKPLASVKSLSH